MQKLGQMIRILGIFLLIGSIQSQQLLSNPKCNHWPDRGTCELQFTVKWYYDRYDHRCRRFFYGGCDGNENRFESLEECSSQCHYEEPSNRDRCFQPHDPGNCHSDIERWFFDQNKKQCVCSWWSGCGGNSNIYYSYNHCMLICGEYAEHGPGIDENYWGPRNKSSISIESQNVFLHPQTSKHVSGPYSVQVPLEYDSFNDIHHPKILANRLGTVNISHGDDGRLGYLHSLPIESVPFEQIGKARSDGVTIHRYDSTPRQLEEIDQSRWRIHEKEPSYENGKMRRRFKMSQGKYVKTPPRMIHLKNNREEGNNYRIKLDQNEPGRKVSYQVVREDEPNNEQHHRITEELNNEAEETQRRIQEQMRRKHFEEWNRIRNQQNRISHMDIITTQTTPRQSQPVDNNEKYHPELVNQFKSHLDEHEKSLRMKLEAQFPNHVITLTPQIETVRYPDGRSIVRQRIQWTAHPKSMYANNQEKPSMSQPTIPSFIPPTTPQQVDPTETEAMTSTTSTTTTTTTPPVDMARIRHEEQQRKHKEEIENRRKEAEKRREEHLKKVKELQEKQKKEREQRIKELKNLEKERRRKYEEELLRRQMELTTTTSTTTTTTPKPDDRIYIPTVTYPVPYPSVNVRPVVYDANVRRPQPTTKTIADPVEHYRPIVEQITSAPLSIEDIIAMDNERGDYEEEYDVPMDFPDTEAPSLAQPTRKPYPTYPTRTPTTRPPPSRSELPSIVLPPSKKSKLFSPISSEEYTQDIDFDPYVDFVM